MCRFHMEWSLWDTDTLWLCVITWSCIAWIAFVSAFTQPTWNINRRIGALIGDGDGERTKGAKGEGDGAGAGNRGDGVADFAEDAAISSQASDCGIQTDVGDARPEVCMHAHIHTRARAHRHGLTRAIPLGQTSRRYLHFPRNIPNPDARGAPAISRKASERASERTHAHPHLQLRTRSFQSAIKRCERQIRPDRAGTSSLFPCDIARLDIVAHPPSRRRRLATVVFLEQANRRQKHDVLSFL